MTLNNIYLLFPKDSTNFTIFFKTAEMTGYDWCWIKVIVVAVLLKVMLQYSQYVVTRNCEIYYICCIVFQIGFCHHFYGIFCVCKIVVKIVKIAIWVYEAN